MQAVKYKCLRCGALFDDKTELDKHDRSTHQPPVQEFRLVDAETGVVVAERFAAIDTAAARALQELDQAPERRFRIERRESAASGWVPKLDLIGYP